jgi:hypothetical protein
MSPTCAPAVEQELTHFRLIPVHREHEPVVVVLVAAVDVGAGGEQEIEHVAALDLD